MGLSHFTDISDECPTIVHLMPGCPRSPAASYIIDRVSIIGIVIGTLLLYFFKQFQNDCFLFCFHANSLRYMKHDVFYVGN